MPRKKNYSADQFRRDQARPIAKPHPGPSSVRERDEAYIDMVALLGPDARFAGNDRALDLREWLDREIDAWVWASVACLKKLLLSGARETSTVAEYHKQLRQLFVFLTETSGALRPATPAGLSPIHVQALASWLDQRRKRLGWTDGSTRKSFAAIKAVLVEMFKQGFIQGEQTRFFVNVPKWRDGESKQTSISDPEQERLARAIKSDLVNAHHGRIELSPAELQALRLLLVAHRQGLNPTPLLEMRRNAMSPGILPGTVRMQTAKVRNRKLRSQAGRAAASDVLDELQPENSGIVFSLAEGAVLRQAIACTQELVADARGSLKNKVWLYRAKVASRGRLKQGDITCVSRTTLANAVKALVKRHGVLGDDGEPLQVNLSRLRKSFFDRALRASDGDLGITANLMGNTPGVAGMNYPSMNDARKADAATFMNDEYMPLTRGVAPETIARPLVINVKSLSAPPGTPSHGSTPVSGCADTLNGQHAPGDGLNHCHRYVMCLFCSSFAIVGTEDELWRLFSFQVFATEELCRLDLDLGVERTADEALEDLRDRYRLAIPFIDEFTSRQFPAGTVAKSRARVAKGLHGFWAHQLAISRRVNGHRLPEDRTTSGAAAPDTSEGGFGT